MKWRGWGGVVAVSVALALVSLLSNLTSAAQLSGEANGVLVVRMTLSKLVNAGTVWAGLSVLAGWLVGRGPLIGRRWWRACAAGAVSGLVALAVHYGVGQVFGVYSADIWASNASWFVAAVVAGVPLGFVGAVANWSSWSGVLARLVVPLGAVGEPLVGGFFTRPEAVPWPDRWSSLVCGAVLMVSGVAGLVRVVVRARMKSAWRRGRQARGPAGSRAGE